MKASIAIGALIAMSSSLNASAAPPADPVSATRNVRTECGGGSTQAKCDQFMADYLAYEAYRDKKKEEDLAARTARNKPIFDEVQRRSEIATLPKLKPGAFAIDLSKQAENAVHSRRPRVEGLVYEYPVTFYLDEKGVPYHSSLWPQGRGFDVSTYEIYEVRQDQVQHCTPLNQLRHLAVAKDEKCVALTGFSFNPAVTIEGKPIASEVQGKFVLSVKGLDFEVVGAKPIPFGAVNQPSQAWLEWNEKVQAEEKQRDLIRQDGEARYKEAQEARLRRMGY